MEAFIVRTDEQEPPHHTFHYYMMYTVIAAMVMLEGAQVRVQMMNALGKKFWKLPTSQVAQRYHAWRRSSYKQTSRHLPIIHSIAIMYTVIVAMSMLEGAQVGVQLTNTLGTNFLSYPLAI